jgi:ceramide synthetase
MARYARAPEWVSTMLFVFFALSWFATRIYAFGFIVIRSTLTDPYLRAEEVGVEIRPHTTILNGLLIFLYILHVYWSYLILRIIVRALKPNGTLDDIREEDAQENPNTRVENKQEN